MNKNQTVSSIIPNINELGELSFLKRQYFQWHRFKDKEKFIPLLRGLTYQYKYVISKMFMFSIKEEKKDKKINRSLQIITQKEIMNLQELYQILNQNADQKQFSEEVEKMKIFEKRLYSYVGAVLSKNYIKFPNKDYLNLNIYMIGNQFYLKGVFNSYNYQIEFNNSPQVLQKPETYMFSNFLVKQQLKKKYEQILQMSESIPLPDDIHTLYKRFYEDTYFFYDEFVLKLQVFHNYPLLRLKNFIPIKFKDDKTGQSLQGPIFSNANPQCMYSHFIGYNADSVKLIEGQYCQNCQILVQQLQQNELLTMMRDNIFNPQKLDVLYCPQYNRFKLLQKIALTIEEQSGEIIEEKVIYQMKIKYLNYYHFCMNFKKLTNKNRMSFAITNIEESFGLTFNILNRKMMIIDPSRGRYCQHFAFTDLRLYYLNYDETTNTYLCPIKGCGQRMGDSDILYLKQVVVLMDYAKFKCEQWQELVQYSKVIIDNSHGKVYVQYKIRDQNTVINKRDELIDYYKTLVDPYVAFSQYSLGIKQKDRKQRLDDYMFGGLREQMRREEEIEEQEDEVYENE